MVSTRDAVEKDREDRTQPLIPGVSYRKGPVDDSVWGGSVVSPKKKAKTNRVRKDGRVSLNYAVLRHRTVDRDELRARNNAVFAKEKTQREEKMNAWAARQVKTVHLNHCEECGGTYGKCDNEYRAFLRGEGGFPIQVPSASESLDVVTASVLPDEDGRLTPEDLENIDAYFQEIDFRRGNAACA